MKKYLMLVSVLGMALASCEDVPAPYEIFDKGDTEEAEKTTLINETFATSLGSFSSVASTGEYDWSVSYSSAQVTAYVNNKNNAAMSWLVSSEIDCSEVESAHISFDYILRYSADATLKDYHQLMISKDYDGVAANITNATWTPLEFYLVQGSDWNTWYSSGSINVPAEYLGGKLYVALRYQSTTSKAGTWEVKNFLMETGAGDYVPEGGDNGGTSGGGTSDGGWINETFASSFGVFSAVNVVGNYSWKIDYSCAQVTSYDSGSKTNNEAESWLVSSAVNTAGTEAAHVSFDYILRYASESTQKEYHQLLISKDYDGNSANISKATWTALDFNLVQGSDWNTWYSSGNVNIPAEYLGGTLYIALRYKADTTKAGTWEVKNFVADQGAGDYNGGNGGTTGGGTTSSTDPTGTGTEDDPYNVAKILESVYKDGETVKDVWVHAYIVGYIPTGTISSTVFESSATVATNIVVADAADETDYNKCMAIQLPSGALRTAVNLKDNEGNYKKEVWLYGEVTKYCGGPGLKSTSKYKLGEAGGSTGGGSSTGGSTATGSYTLATSIAEGTYLIGAEINGVYKLATNLGSKTYGYLTGVEARAADGVISTASTAEAWTFKSDGNYYTIQDSDGRYLYMTGTYNSFNVDATKPSEGATWEVSFQSDNTVKIVNTSTSKTIQWSTQYSSYGSYADVTNVLPSLFLKK